MLKGVDCSNFQGPPDEYAGQSWYTDAEFIIFQAIKPPSPYKGWDVGGYTAAQLRQAKADGKHVGVYVWLWDSFASSTATKADIRARLALIPDDVQLDMRLWLDVEDTGPEFGPPRQQDVLDALEVMDEWATAHGLPPTGVYSGAWYISGYLGGWFPEGRMYWMADYSIAPELFPMRPVHQYASTPVDLNVMLETEIVTIAEPAPGPNRETPDGWAWPTYRESAINYRAIADELGARAEKAEAIVDAVRVLVSIKYPRITQIRKAVGL